MFWRKRTSQLRPEGEIDIDSFGCSDASSTNLIRQKMLEPLLKSKIDCEVIDGRRNSVGNQFSSRLHLVESGQVNAYMSLIGSTHHIIVHSAVLNGAYFLANSLLNCKQVLSEYGVAETEGSLNSLPNIYNDLVEYSNTSWKSDKTIETLQSLTPGCPVRARLADKIYSVILRFVCLHELAHGALGHLHFLGGVKGINMIGDGWDIANIDGEDWNLSQVLEFECDVDALLTICDSFVQSEEYNSGQENKELHARLIFIGVVAIIWLISSRKELIGVDAQPRDSHPQALVRSLILLLYFNQIAGRYSFFRSKQSVLKDDMWDLINSSFAFSQFIPLTVAGEEKTSDLIDSLLNHVNIAINVNRNELRHLGKFRYVHTKLLGGYDGL